MPEQNIPQDTGPNVSIQDIADSIPSNDTSAVLWGDRDKKDAPTGVDNYSYPGSLLDPALFKNFVHSVVNESFRQSGQGGYDNLLQLFLSRIDRHGTLVTPLNALNYGFTFITRPRLNLSGGNLRSHPITSTLESMDPNSVPFAIRFLLDTRLANNSPIYRGTNGPLVEDLEAKQFSELAALQSAVVDPLNPFLVPLQNGLKGISGFPDFTIQEETTEGDFHSGDFTFAKGSDFMNRTQELSLEFRDTQGSIILATIYYWLLVIALQAKGVMMAYQDDIFEQRLNYTVSIYRFVTDPTRRNILWWAKATGCFPKSAPVGALFNINQGEVTVSSAMNFSVPFVANDVKVNHPGILMDFRRLMERYAGGSINPEHSEHNNLWKKLDSRDLGANFNALPYISINPQMGIEMEWFTSPIYMYADQYQQELERTYAATLTRQQQMQKLLKV